MIPQSAAVHLRNCPGAFKSTAQQCSTAKSWISLFTADTDARQGFNRGFNKQMLPQEHHVAAKVSVRKAKKLTTGAGQEIAGGLHFLSLTPLG